MLNLLKNKKVLFTVIGFLPLSVSILFTPIYIDYLSVKDYGFINLYNTLIGLIAPILHLGIKDGFGFLYWKNAESPTQLNLFFKKSLSAIIVMQFFTMFVFILIGHYLIGFFFKSFNEIDYKHFVLIVGFHAFFLNVNDLFFYYFRNKGETKQFVLLNVFSLILMTIGSIIGIIFLNLGLDGAIIGKFIGYIVVVIIFSFVYMKKSGFEFDFHFFKKIIYSGFPILLSTIIGGYSSVCDKFYLQKHFSLDTLGIYVMELTITSLVEILLISSMHYVLPEMLNKIKLNSSQKEIISPIADVSYILSIFCFFVLACSPFVLKLFPENYYEVLVYLPFLCVTPFIKLFINLNTLNFYLYESSKVFLKIQILTSLFIVAITYWMPMKYYIHGAIAIVIMYNVIQLLITYAFLFKESYFVLKDKKIIFLCLFSLFLLISLGFIYSYTHYMFLFLIPLFLYLIVLFFIDNKLYIKAQHILKNKVK